MRKRGNGSAFYGDTGTKFTGNAREDIEKQESSGAGHPGNNVDISQRHAQSESDEYTEQAERMTRDMERDRRLGIPTDPDKRREFVEGMAEQLRGRPTTPQQPAKEQRGPSIDGDGEFSSGDPLNSERLSGDPLSKGNAEKWNRSRKKL